ncbi:hypothetical protein IAT38_005453 [Cryptococcus sp. DSM 104549]
MDFIKKMATEQLESALNGGNSNQNQNQQQGNNNNSYGNNNNQQQSYGQSDSYGSSNNQNQSYGQNQNQGYGQNQNQGSGYGGNQQQDSYGNNQNQNQGGYNSNQNQGGYNSNQNQGGYNSNQNQGSGGYGQTGGAEFNRPHGDGGASSGNNGLPNINQNAAINAANSQNSNGDANSGLFGQAMSFLNSMNKDDTDVDEEKVQKDHQQAYGQGNAGSMSASSMGAAAAMQALKKFTSGGGDTSANKSGGGDMQSKIIGMAMSEAAKLFDQSGGAAQGNKQDAVTSAGQVIMKMLLKNQVSGMMGGSNSGGLSGLMGMASKFMS